MADRPAAVRPSSRRAAGMPRSAIREIMNLASTRPKVIHLEVGEPDAITPAHIIDGAFAGVKAGATKYTGNLGIPSLRQKIASRVSSAWGVAVSPDQVGVTTGAIGALYGALMSVVDAGDEVLIPDPGWPNYESIVHLAGATPVRFAQPASRGFLPDIAEIERLVTPRTKVIVVNTPGNPSGAVFPRNLMKAIVELVQRTGIYLVSDEIYEDIIFEGEHVSAGSFGATDRVFVVSGFSKSYAMTGWRLGWLICPPDLAATVSALQEPVVSCPSAVSQQAGEAALSGDQACVARFRDTFMRRRDIVVDTFGNSGLLPIVPQGAFYALIDISRTGQASLPFAKEVLTTQDVAVVPGITFGPSCDRYLRIAYTIGDDDLRTGLKRLRSAIERAAG